MNKNQLTTNPVQNSNFDLKNPLIAVTAILTVGVCYCTTVIVNAKYNRDIELKYKDYSLNIQPSVPAVAV